jgi:hypothetical protein
MQQHDVPAASFFGLNCLEGEGHTNFIGGINLKIFSDEEYLEAFDKCQVDRSGYLDTAEITALLKTVMNPPGCNADPRPEIVDHFMAHFDTNSDGKISRAEFEEGLQVLKEQSHHTSRVVHNRSTLSHDALISKMKKQSRLENNPIDKLATAKTTSQNIGFTSPSEADENPAANLPKSSCAETQYAESMVKAGVYF